jgi:hypothetical protein
MNASLSLRAPLAPAKPSVGRRSSAQPDDVPRTFLGRMFVACHILQLQTETRFTAIVLLHRYARAKAQANGSVESTSDGKGLEDLPWVGAACIFLACKVEEETRRLRDVINMVHMVLSSLPRSSSSSKVGDVEAEANGGVNNPKDVILISASPPDLNQEYWKSKKRVVETEQAVLRWLGFDVSVSHPHRAVFLILEAKAGNRDKVLAIAFRRLNDALFWPDALEHTVIELACASIDLALEEVERDDAIAGGNGLGGGEITTVRHLTNEFLVQFHTTAQSIEFCKDHLIQATNYLEKATQIN